MVARLKLKEIDGRAPPGVKWPCASALQALLQIASRKGGGVPSNASRHGGNTFKLRGRPQASVTKPAPRGAGGRVSSPGTVTTLRIRGPSAPKPLLARSYGEGSETRRRWVALLLKI